MFVIKQYLLNHAIWFLIETGETGGINSWHPCSEMTQLKMANHQLQYDMSKSLRTVPKSYSMQAQRCTSPKRHASKKQENVDL